MDLAKVQVSGIHARVAYRTGISAGIVGARVLFDYTDPLWDGLIKNVVFEGAQTVSILNAGNEVALPAEVATDAGVEIRVGVCGVKTDGQMIIPTLWAELGIVQDAVPVDLGEEAVDPVPPAWAQLEAMIGDLSKLPTEEKTNLVAAVNELAQKSGGNADPEEVRRIVEAYLAENPPKGEKGDPGPQGEKGEPGDDYVLTDADKTEIAEMAAEMVDKPMTSAVATLLISILRNAVYSADQSANITELAAELGVVESGDSGEDAGDNENIGNANLLKFNGGTILAPGTGTATIVDDHSISVAGGYVTVIINGLTPGKQYSINYDGTSNFSVYGSKKDNITVEPPAIDIVQIKYNGNVPVEYRPYVFTLPDNCYALLIFPYPGTWSNMEVLEVTA
jgi:hypothetical protein